MNLPGHFAKRAAAVLIVVLLAIQFVPVDRSNPPVESEIVAPAKVRSILARACYDCHSNQSVWPWYSYVAPVSWLVAHDVNDGREHLNFSTWNRYSAEDQNRNLEEIWEHVEEGEMPLWYYLPMHPDAELSASDLAVLREWTGSAEDMPSSHD